MSVSAPRAGRLKDPALYIVIVALAGMTYCHVVDVQMKLEEHVYYMAALFFANIALSVVLVPAFFAAYASGSARLVRVTWIAAGALAVLTIAGFMYSRTIGFPRMEDHIGEWDRLGVSSLVFEGAIAVLSVLTLRHAGRPSSGSRTARITAGLTGVLCLLVLVPVAFADDMGMDGADGTTTENGMMMTGDMRLYPVVAGATPKQLARVTGIWRATRANSSRFATVKAARRLGYKFNRREIATLGYPAIYHARKRGARFWGRVLDPTAPQALMYWCTAPRKCTLIGVMYRAPGASMPPTYGPLLMWHKHIRRRTDGTWMTHVWLTRGLRAALARCAPWPYLTSALGVQWQEWGPKSELLQDCPTATSQPTRYPSG